MKAVVEQAQIVETPWNYVLMDLSVSPQDLILSVKETIWKVYTSTEQN